MGQLIDLTRRRFGRLTVLRRDLSYGPATAGIRVRWICECDCSSLVSVTAHDLKAGDSASCGCLHKELLSNRSKTHGQTSSPTYHSWVAAKMRCTDPANVHYEQYGGRGIAMCDRWSTSFDAFLADMGERPDGMSIERIDVNGDYSPGNCKWATPKEQANNTRYSRLIDWRGGRRNLSDIAALECIPRTSLNKTYLKVRDMEVAVALVRSLMKRSP